MAIVNYNGRKTVNINDGFQKAASQFEESSSKAESYLRFREGLEGDEGDKDRLSKLRQVPEVELWESSKSGPRRGLQGPGVRKKEPQRPLMHHWEPFPQHFYTVSFS